LIFATVGTQLPFERLIRGLDSWAEQNPGVSIFAQTGEAGYQPSNIDFSVSLSPVEFESRFEEADVVVAHAGMGTILQCLDIYKPLIIMPRIASQGEHRNDHQLATAEKFKRFDNIQVVENDEELWKALDNPPSPDSDLSSNSDNLEQLINEIRTFVQQG